MQKMNYQKLLTIGVLSLALLVSYQSASGQNLIAGDPSDTFDLQAVFVNPAVIPFHHRQILVGMRLYQVGFLNASQFGLRSSYIGFTLPQIFSGLLDVGFTGQNFSTQLYDQTNFSLQLAKQALERVFVGAKYNLFTKSYHREYFDLENDNDPVFANGTLKFAHSFGAGLVVFPWSHLALSFSCDHINQPDVSLFKTADRQPMTLDFGARYSFGHFSSSIYFNNQHNFWQMNGVFESRPTPTTIFKIGYVQNAAKFEAQLDVRNGFSINYMFDYPFYEVNQLSRGCHQITCLVQLDHKVKLKELQFSKYNNGKFPLFDLPAQVTVELDCDNLEIVSRRIVHTVDPKIPPGALAYLTDIDLSLTDTTIHLSDFRTHGNPNRKEPAALYGSPKYSKKYQDYLERLIRQSDRAGNQPVELISDANSLDRANHMRSNLITGKPELEHKIQIKKLDDQVQGMSLATPGAIPATTNDIIEVNPKTAIFRITSIKIKNDNSPWELVITDHSGNLVKSFRGKGELPAAISWDWRDARGNLVAPNLYFYHFQCRDKKETSIQSPHQSFYVKKISRTVYVDLRSSPYLQKDARSIVEIKFSN